MFASRKPPRTSSRGSFSLPPPDTTGGLAFAASFTVGLVYILLLVADYNTMLAWGWWIASLLLVIGVIGTFSLATMVGGDIASFQSLDLNLARAVLAGTSGTPAPAPESALSGVWRAYVTTGEEIRRSARVHAYALGPFLLGSALAVGAVLLLALGLLTTTSDLIGLGLVIGIGSFFFVFLGGMTLLMTVGYTEVLPGFDHFAPRRWHRNETRQPAVDEALASVPWLHEFHRGTRDARPTGTSTLFPAWRE